MAFPPEEGEDAPTAFDAFIERAGPEREFIADGRRWRVFLMRPTYDRRRACLVFESDTVMRTVRHFPDDWPALSDAELEALSWKL